MELQNTILDRTKSVRVAGDINLPDIQTLKRELEDFGPFAEVRLDLSEMGFAGSSLISLLVEIRNRRPEHYRKLKLVNPNDYTLELLRLTGMTHLYEVRCDDPALFGD